MKKSLLTLVLIAGFSMSVMSSSILIRMDEGQTNHLKAYGVAYWVLQNEIEVDWLLNYHGGSFMFKYYQKFEQFKSAILEAIRKVNQDKQYKEEIQTLLNLKFQTFKNSQIYAV